jgi:hypothetical protein
MIDDSLTSISREQWQRLADDLSAQRPSVGKRVRVSSGKKFLGRVGIVRWHGPDKYARDYYRTPAQLDLRDLRGRDGFRIRVESDGESFFVGADQVEVIPA